MCSQCFFFSFFFPPFNISWETKTLIHNFRLGELSCWEADTLNKRHMPWICNWRWASRHEAARVPVNGRIDRTGPSGECAHGWWNRWAKVCSFWRRVGCPMSQAQGSVWATCVPNETDRQATALPSSKANAPVAKTIQKGVGCKRVCVSVCYQDDYLFLLLMCCLFCGSFGSFRKTTSYYVVCDYGKVLSLCIVSYMLTTVFVPFSTEHQGDGSSNRNMERYENSMSNTVAYGAIWHWSCHVIECHTWVCRVTWLRWGPGSKIRGLSLFELEWKRFYGSGG